MKKSGPHPVKALSHLKIQSDLPPGRYADGNGLYIVITKAKTRQWIARFTFEHKRMEMGLGSYRNVSLSQARERNNEIQSIVKSGKNPISEKIRSEKINLTFAEAAILSHTELKCAWKCAKHTHEWITTVNKYANPVIGSVPIDKIRTCDIVQILAPIWLQKPATARRLKQRILQIFDWAKANDLRSYENPVLGVERGLAKQKCRTNHYKALPYAEIGRFFCQLDRSKSGWTAINALKFLIFTAGRTSEILEAEWSEIDFKNAVWSIPAPRMKAGRPHNVPLGKSALLILENAKIFSGNSRYVFLGRDGLNHPADMIFLNMIRRLGSDVTAHGFRSTFRDWAAEQTDFDGDVCEMALAHTVRGSVQRAYRRGDLFEKRRKLMNAWDTYITDCTEEHC